MITVVFLLLVAFAALEMNLLVLLATVFLDLVILATINTALKPDDGGSATDWE